MAKVTLTHVFQLLLGVFGIATFDLYRLPSEKCIQVEECGLWIQDILPESSSYWVFLISGGGEYALLNAYFAFIAIPMVIQAIKERKTPRAKVATALFIPLAALPKLISQYFIASNTEGAKVIDIALSVGGVVASNLYAAASIAKNDISRLYSNIKTSCIFNRFRTADENSVIKHCQKQKALFCKKLEDNWLIVLEKIKAKDASLENLKTSQDPIHFLLNQNNETRGESSSASFIRAFFQTLGWISMGLPFLGILFLNLFNGFKKNNYTPPSATALALLIVTLEIYLVSKFFIETFGSLFDVFKNIFQCKPINSLTFSLYRNLQPFLLITSFFLSLCSYAVFGMIFNKNYPNNWLYENDQKDLRWIPITGANLYHFIGAKYLINLLLKTCIRNEIDKKLLNLEEKITEIKKMTVTEFGHFSLKNATHYNITLWKPSDPAKLNSPVAEAKTISESTPLLSNGAS